MTLFRVDEAKCKRDGICVETCPVGILQLGERGVPEGIPMIEQHCIGCGHCVAVCPHGALDNERAPLSRMRAISRKEVVEPETAALLLRSRRSIRAYKEKPVPREILRELLDMARFAPSAHNDQGVAYIVVDTPEGMLRVREIVVEWMRRVALEDPARASRYTMPGIIRMHEMGIDKILRGAPALVVATVPRGIPMPEVSAVLCLQYAELYAPTLGLGTCWAGYAMMCAGLGPDLPRHLGVRDGYSVAGMLMVGYPKYRYHRLPDRNPLDLSWHDPSGDA